MMRPTIHEREVARPIWEGLDTARGTCLRYLNFLFRPHTDIASGRALLEIICAIGKFEQPS